MNLKKKQKTLRSFLWLFLVNLLFPVSALYAQQTITGKVSEASSGETLIGATVVIKGTTNGTVTNVDGNYSLNVPRLQDTLVFSFVGYQSQEVPVAGRMVINVQMQASDVMLSEMVVIGYGTVKKSDLTGSVAVVSSEDLTRIPASNFTRALQGRAPGVLVTQSGSPGSNAQIRVRGVGSITKARTRFM